MSLDRLLLPLTGFLAISSALRGTISNLFLLLLGLASLAALVSSVAPGHVDSQRVMEYLPNYAQSYMVTGVAYVALMGRSGKRLVQVRGVLGLYTLVLSAFCLHAIWNFYLIGSTSYDFDRFFS